MYTIVINSTVYRHESPESAADLLLSHDGFEHEIRAAADGGHWLWTSDFSRNSPCGGRPLTRSVIYSVEDDLDRASLDIAVKVLKSGHWESDSITVWLDAEYDAMLAEDAADERNLLIEAVKAWANCAEAAIDDGGIWIAEPQIGHWLSLDEVAEFYAWHEAA